MGPWVIPPLSDLATIVPLPNRVAGAVFRALGASHRVGGDERGERRLRRQPVDDLTRLGETRLRFRIEFGIGNGRNFQMNKGETRYTGGCLCGMLRYEAVGEPLYIGHCYCTDCQKASGSGVHPVLGVLK